MLFHEDGTMAIIGTHMLLYTPEPDALRAVLRDVFNFTHVDAGQGWLIFRLPPAELGIHPAEGSGPAATQHSMSFMCDDIQATVKELRAKGVTVKGEPEDHGYGIVVMATLPGGVEVQVYEPRHALAIDTAARS
jgi:predicted enzyme related to lactoylglutathione lyase